MRVLLDGTFYNTFDDVLLCIEEDLDVGQHGQKGGGLQQVPFLDLGACKGGDRQGDGLHLAAAHHQEGEQVVIPDPDAV